MIRTYRSKKETGGGVDRKDLLQNLDEKSSAFDAYYIQNIKQTKRELSCVGSSNQYTVASNKVRKRKYVRRIVKDIETRPRESVSSLAYLTPDKSIRVNKPLDPFDLLLNSSPMCLMGPSSDKAETVSSKVDMFNEYAVKKVNKAYSRKRPIKVKKFNYSSGNSDSDKENSDELTDFTRNTSDIKAHELFVEHDRHQSPKPSDDSINNIVKNVSLLSRIQQKNSLNESMRKSLRFNRNRLTSNIQSPILNSPLCSTPYNMKYRGKSIYKFSPIALAHSENEPNGVEVPDNSDDCNNSFIFLSKGNKFSPNNENEENYLSPINNVSTNNDTTDNVMECEKKHMLETVEPKSILLDTKHELEVNMTRKDSEIVGDEKSSSLQTTEIEPFRGFSHITNHVLEGNDEVVVAVNEINTIPEKFHAADSIIDESIIQDNNDSYISNYISNDKIDNDSLLESSDVDDESFYDTCSTQNSEDGKFISREPRIHIQRMNDSSFLRYYQKMSSYANDDDKSHYESSDDNTEEFNSLTSSNKENSNSYTDDDSSENESDNCSESVSFNIDLESNSNSDEEKCVSFVTTRKKNDATNNSIISIFDDSNSSLNTNCDKTVLINSNVGDVKIIEDASEVNDSRDKLQKNSTITNTNEIIESVTLCDDAPKHVQDENDTRTSFVTTRKSSIKPKNIEVSLENPTLSHTRQTCFEGKQGIVLQPGKKWERSLSIYRRMTMMTDHFDQSILEDEPMESKGRKYRQSVITTMEMQDLQGSLHNESINSRRSTFVAKPRSTIRFIKDSSSSRISINTTIFDDLKGFLNEECDDTIVELSKLSIADSAHEVTVIDNFHDTSGRIATARDYVLRRCNQTDAILFDECYPDTVLKNCHKIGEGVYGEVFLWRARDGRARVLKIVPIAGSIKVNGESQKDFHEIISEIVIAMELSALRAPIADIERHLDDGKSVEALDLHTIENATDVFNEVLAVRCVYGSYPSRLLDLWDLYDECKGSENDNPAILPVDQQYIVLELANAGQDLESYQFNNAEQAHALFLQVAYGLAVAEEAYQFEHRDLHWGNVLIAPTDQKLASFVLRGRLYRVGRCGVSATIIDYSLSRVTVPLPADSAALYNDLAADEGLFDAVGDYQFEVYRLMRDKLGNDWKNFEPYTNILWLHYTVDKMITALRYKRTNTKLHKHYIDKLKGIKSRILDYGSAALFVLTDNEI